jgi:ribosomal protein L27
LGLKKYPGASLSLIRRDHDVIIIGEYVDVGDIIVRQHGTKNHPGANVRYYLL